MENPIEHTFRVVESCSNIPILHRELIPYFKKILSSDLDINQITITGLKQYLIDSRVSNFSNFSIWCGKNFRYDKNIDITKYHEFLLSCGFLNNVIQLKCNVDENKHSDKVTIFIHNESVRILMISKDFIISTKTIEKLDVHSELITYINEKATS